jgi:hypothetical protein
LKEAANPRYQVEVGLVRLMEMRRLAPLGDLIERIAALEDALRTGKPPAERKTPQSAPGGGSAKAGARTASATGSGKSASSAAERRVVDEPSVAATNSPSDSVVDQIKVALEQKRRRLLVAALDAARRAQIEGEELIIEFAPEARQARDTLAKPENAKALREACTEVCGREIGIRFAIKETGDQVGKTASPDKDEQHPEEQARRAITQHPTVQQALRAFGGQIVDIKLQ